MAVVQVTFRTNEHAWNFCQDSWGWFPGCYLKQHGNFVLVKGERIDVDAIYNLAGQLNCGRIKIKPSDIDYDSLDEEEYYGT